MLILLEGKNKYIGNYNNNFLLLIKPVLLLPLFILLFGYTFSVVTNVLDEYKSYYRVLIGFYFFIFIMFNLKSKISIYFLLFELGLFICLISIFFLNKSLIVINFVFLILVLHFFYTLKISKKTFLANALVAYLLVLFIYIIYLVLSGVSLDPVIIGDRERYYWGSENPNKAALFIFSFLVLLVMSYVYFKFSFWVLLISVLPMLFLLVMTGSRTAMLSIVLFFILICLKTNVFIYFWARIIPVVFLGVSISLSLFHEHLLINTVLSSRPEDIHGVLSMLTWSNYLFGFNFNGVRLDNSYIQAYFNLGFIPYLVFVILFIKAAPKLDKVDAAYVFVMLVYGLFEGILVRTELLLTLFFYYLLFISVNKKISGLNT